MIKLITKLLFLSLQITSLYSQESCTNIWSMDNNINGISLYKVTINMCTEGIFVPDNLEERTTPAISFIDYNITNTSRDKLKRNVATFN